MARSASPVPSAPGKDPNLVWAAPPLGSVMISESTTFWIMLLFSSHNRSRFVRHRARGRSAADASHRGSRTRALIPLKLRHQRIVDGRRVGLERHGSMRTPGLSRPCGSSAFFAARSVSANSGGPVGGCWGALISSGGSALGDSGSTAATGRDWMSTGITVLGRTSREPGCSSAPVAGLVFTGRG